MLTFGGLAVMLVTFYAFYFFSLATSPFLSPSGTVERDRRSFRVAMFSDSGLMTDALENICARISRSGAEFAVFAGDIARHRTPYEFNHIAGEIREGLEIPLYAAPGNHDIHAGDDSGAAYESVFGPRHYFFGYGDTLFVMLDSSKLKLDKAQFQWLEEVLRFERPRFRRCVLISHVPPFDPRSKETHCLPPADAERLRRLVDAYRVDLVVSGHVHKFYSGSFGKARLIVLPTSGELSRDPGNGEFGYVQFDFLPGGGIRIHPVFCTWTRGREYVEFFFSSDLTRNSGVFLFGFLCAAAGAVLFCRGGAGKKTKKD